MLRFRNTGEITALAGCDYLTIAPKLLAELQESNEPCPEARGRVGQPAGEDKVTFVDDEAKFRWSLFEDQMAFEKLHEGIRGFAKDGQLRIVVRDGSVLMIAGNTLKDMLKQKLQA